MTTSTLELDIDRAAISCRSVRAERGEHPAGDGPSELYPTAHPSCRIVRTVALDSVRLGTCEA